MKILVVDDSRTMRRTIKNILLSGGYDNIAEANNGIEALDSLEDVDLVLLDWTMPLMDGLTCTKEIRKMFSKDLPIIMVTAQGSQEEVVKAMKFGVNDYIIKPVTQNVLLHKIELVTHHQTTHTPGNRLFTLTPTVNQVINRLADTLDKEGIESRNASKLVRYCVLNLCRSTNEEDIHKAVEQIRNDDAWKAV